MKKTDLQKVINEAIEEVVQEIITAPVDKDPALMTPDEKKQALVNARTQAGTTDQNTPVDLVKREGKLREMARTAIQYKLADDWQEKLNTLKSAYSEKKGKWFDVLVKGIESAEGGKATIGDVARTLNLPQQRLNQFGIEAYNAGVIVPSGMSGRGEMPAQPGEEGGEAESPRIVPQHAKNNPDSEDYEEPRKFLSALADPNSNFEPEDLFIGGDFDDDFENGTLSYDVTDPTSMEPDEEDDIEKQGPTKPGQLSVQDSIILDKYDDLVKSIASLRGTLRQGGKRFGTEPGGIREFDNDNSKSINNQQEILQRKRQELANLLRQHGGMIQKYRDLGKLKSLIKQDDEELPAEFDGVDLDETVKSRLQELAKIKK
jgi:hypothetical protein